jgi:hypothetical protein
VVDQAGLLTDEERAGLEEQITVLCEVYPGMDFVFAQQKTPRERIPRPTPTIIMILTDTARAGTTAAFCS